MLLKSLNLTNFRNYSSLALNFDSHPTILVGNNAVGKSNILEAIYLLSTTKSGRVDTELELIKQGESFAHVVGVVDEMKDGKWKIEGGETLEIVIQVVEERLSKRVKANGVSRRMVDFIGNLPAVIFYPSDINMVTGSPSLRRWHLDLGLAQVDFRYKKALTLYEQILVSRNRVLKRIKEGWGKMDELDYWTDGVVREGRLISDKRKDFFSFINGLDKPLGNFLFEYQPSEVTLERLEETNGREVAAATTLIGPHRDNFEVQVRNSNFEMSNLPSAGRNLSKFGSRGEQRVATLAFKLSQLEYMAKILGKRPILLLDDIFSELDLDHRAHVVEIVGKQQTIIATVELENIPKAFLDQSRILRVEDEKIL